MTHADRVSHEAALVKAETEHEKYRALEAAKPSPVEADFEEAVQKAKQLEAGRKKPKK